MEHDSTAFAVPWPAVPEEERRAWLKATAAARLVAAGAVAVPLVSSLAPSERAKALGAPVEVDIGGLLPGEMMTVAWRGKPVWILRRTSEMLADLARTADLADPDSMQEQQPPYARNAVRVIRPEYFVVVGICTHLGCSPLYRPEVGPADLGADWQGGYFCPCHGSKFDLAGRVYAGVPAPKNLVVPPHRYESDTRIVVGEDQGAA